MQKCFLYDICSHKDCDNDFCLRKYKMDSLYSAALMTESQKQHIVLKVDQDGTDLEQFKALADIEKNIVKFVEEGKNLYLHSANCGNGKSSWAIRLTEAYFNKIWARTEPKCRALFISVPRFLLALKDSITNKSEWFWIVLAACSNILLHEIIVVIKKIKNKKNQKQLVAFL